MGKPSIGTALTPALEKEQRQIIKELAILNDGSEESIFHLIFSETDNGSSDTQ